MVPWVILIDKLDCIANLKDRVRDSSIFQFEHYNDSCLIHSQLLSCLTFLTNKVYLLFKSSTRDSAESAILIKFVHSQDDQTIHRTIKFQNERIPRSRLHRYVISEIFGTACDRKPLSSLLLSSQKTFIISSVFAFVFREIGVLSKQTLPDVHDTLALITAKLIIFSVIFSFRMCSELSREER